jgi:low temperature requirement protein LtrA
MSHTAVPLHERMTARDPNEPNRSATPLELFLDLAFVVAVAQAAGTLHHELNAGHVRDALLTYPAVFFAVWWAWMNITWFASAYDTDDVPYRIASLVQMAGVLILAVGTPRAFEHGDWAVVTLGYVVMRLALVSQWLRAAGGHPECRVTCRRYAFGEAVLQLGWILLLFVPDAARPLGFAILVACELLVPTWAERAGATPWHPGHIAERYGLFTIIVLGESVLAPTVAISTALDGGEPSRTLLPIAFGGLVTVFCMWWIYFSQPGEQAAEFARDVFLDQPRYGFIWGYGHAFVFASAAAAGAGLTIAVDRAVHDSALSRTGAALAFTVPVAIYLLSTWLLHARHKPHPGMLRGLVPAICVLVLATSWLPEAVPLTGVLLVGMIALATAAHVRLEAN